MAVPIGNKFWGPKKEKNSLNFTLILKRGVFTFVCIASAYQKLGQKNTFDTKYKSIKNVFLLKLVARLGTTIFKIIALSMLKNVTYLTLDRPWI
jgi:hypothetical protein